MPKLWRETLAAHREDVRDSIFQTAASLVARNGLHSVTMSAIAEGAGIGRATLYRYFPDVETVLLAWHERQVDDHLAQLERIAVHTTPAGERLAAVLTFYAEMLHSPAASHSTEVGELLHQGGHMAEAHERLHAFVRDVLADGALSGAVRDDVAPDELASFCLYALGAARLLSTEAAVRRLVSVTLDGVRRPASPS